MTSVAKVGKRFEVTRVLFNWADFVEGSTLTTVPCEYETDVVPKAKIGTSLELIGLKDNWLQRDFNTLRRSISGLTMAGEVRRRGFKDDRGFAIKLQAEQFEYGEGLIIEQLVDSGWGRLHGHVTPDGKASFKLRGNYLSGEKTWTSDASFSNIGGVSCDISHFASGEAYELVRNKRILTKAVLALLRQEAGVRVYYQSFRVFPLGERGDDWLGLDRDAAARRGSFSHKALNEIAVRLGLDSRVPLMRPRNENLVGKIHIGGDAGRALEIKMNREGFVENDSYREFVNFVRLAIEWMTIYYAQARSRYDKERAAEAERAFLRDVKQKERSQPTSTVVGKAVDFLADRAIDATRAEPDAAPQKRTIEHAEQVIKSRIQELGSEIVVLRTLASTAPLLFTFAHEVSALIGRLSSNALRIEAWTKHLANEDEKTEAVAIADSLRETAKNFGQMSELFGIVSSARQSKRRRLYVYKIIDKIVSGTRFSTTEAGIDVRIVCEKLLKSPSMFEAELVSVLVNLYTNAIKSSLAAQRRNMTIKVWARERRGALILEVLDQGVGLAKKYWDEVMEPFCSDPADKIYSKLEVRIGTSTVSALGRGSGLGLSIVKGICGDYGGRVEISKPADWSLSVSAEVPYRKA